MQRFYVIVGKNNDAQGHSDNLIFWSTDQNLAMDIKGNFEKQAFKTSNFKVKFMEILTYSNLSDLEKYFQRFNLFSGVLADPVVALSFEDSPYLIWGAEGSDTVYVEELSDLSTLETIKLVTSLVEIKCPDPGSKLVPGYDDNLTMYAIVMAKNERTALNQGQVFLQQITDNDEWRPTSCF